MRERLQKLIAKAGLASRRQAEQWIEQGRVELNGAPAKLGEQADLAIDRVLVDGRVLGRAEEKISLLMNKPRGYVTTLNDPQGRKIVTDLLVDVSQRVFPVGRLDLNTEGLLLLTNDGALAQAISHPRHQVEKTYLVRARGKLTAAQKTQLCEGVSLEDGPTAPARLGHYRESGSNCWFELTIHEGRNRQVRRMCEAVGLWVVRLKRIRLAMLTLDKLPVGHSRPLTEQEVRALKRL